MICANACGRKGGYDRDRHGESEVLVMMENGGDGTQLSLVQTTVETLSCVRIVFQPPKLQ